MEDWRHASLVGVLLIASVACTATPTAAPVLQPTVAPTPTVEPTLEPTPTPIKQPTLQPTAAPTAAPTQPPQPAAQQQQIMAEAPANEQCPPPSGPLPAPGSPGAQDFFRSFRIPLVPSPLFDPPGPKHVGLQAGHWLTDEVPAELGRLQAGATGGGKQEWEVNLDVAHRTAALLEADGIQADVLPATIPEHYRANAFLALHADGDPSGQAHGFKIARPGFSSLPDVDDRFVNSLYDAYAAATDLPRDDEHISLRMRYYYAFNSRRYCHAVAPGVPQAIIEMAYLTSAADRQLLIGDPDRLARGIANGVEAFLATEP